MGRHFGRMGWVMPPMGVLYLAAQLERDCIDVRVYDAQVEDRSLAEVLAEYNPNIVGITCATALVESTFAAARLVKEHSADTVVVVGGVHPTVRPTEDHARLCLPGAVARRHRRVCPRRLGVAPSDHLSVLTRTEPIPSDQVSSVPDDGSNSPTAAAHCPRWPRTFNFQLSTSPTTNRQWDRTARTRARGGRPRGDGSRRRHRLPPGRMARSLFPAPADHRRCPRH